MRLLLVLLVWTLGSAAAAETVLVTKVASGDSFVAGTGRRVRLYGVDAPEIGLPGGGDAWVALHKLIYRKRVGLRNIQLGDWGRESAIVTLDGNDVAITLLRRGVVLLDLNRATDPVLREAYRKAAEEGRLARRGIWFTPAISVQAEPRVVSPAAPSRAPISRQLAITMYSMPGCAACVQTRPHAFSAAAEMGVPIRTVDRRTMETVRLGIFLYPTIVATSHGIEIGRLEGAANHQTIRNFIAKLKGAP